MAAMIIIRMPPGDKASMLLEECGVIAEITSMN
jgi:hypothetical protein